MFDTVLSPAYRVGHRNPEIARALDRTNIIPVNPEFVEQHRNEQVAKNPPSWFVRHQVLAGLLTTVGASALSGLICATAIKMFFRDFIYSSGNGSIIMAMIVACVMAIGFLLFVLCLDLVKVKGYARWEESYLTLREARAEAPIQIADKAIDLYYELPGAQIIIGRLVQDKVVLDPYLVVEYRGDRVVVGVWDGDNIIA